MPSRESVLDRVRIRAMRPEEYPAVQEVVGRSFEEHISRNPGALEEYPHEPWYDPEHLLVAEVDGQLVSQMGVRDGSLWIDGRPFPAGLLGTVCTVPEYRGRGIGAKLVQASFEWMDRRGIALSYLHTSEARYAFYGREGYRLSPYYQPKAVLRTEHIPGGVETTDRVRIRRAAAEDAEACNTLYELYYGRLSGAWSRTEAFWVRRLAGKPKLWFAGCLEFWIAEAEALLAYLAVVRDETPRIVELAALPGEEGALRGLLGHMMREMNAPEVEISIGSRDPLWTDLRGFLPEERTGHGYVMVRAQDRAAFLQQVEALVGSRATAANLSCEAHFGEGEPPVRLGEGGRSAEIGVSLHDLCALVYNGERLEALLEEGAVEIQEGTEADLRVLFPETFPARCPLDGY